MDILLISLLAYLTPWILPLSLITLFISVVVDVLKKKFYRTKFALTFLVTAIILLIIQITLTYQLTNSIKNTPLPIYTPQKSTYPSEAHVCKEDRECAIFTCKCGTSLRKDYKGPPTPPSSACTVVCDVTPKCINNRCTGVTIK